jgi:hypothetical protein
MLHLGRVGRNGWLSPNPVYSKTRDTASSSIRPISAEEAYFRRKNARVRSNDEPEYGYDETGTELPSSDLSHALHSYVSRFIARPNIGRKYLQYRSMDMTALLAMSILIDEGIKSGIESGDTGYLALLEGDIKGNDGRAGDVWWDGRSWVRSVLEPGALGKTKSGVETDHQHVDKREEFEEVDENMTTRSSQEDGNEIRHFKPNEPPGHGHSLKLRTSRNIPSKYDLIQDSKPERITKDAQYSEPATKYQLPDRRQRRSNYTRLSEDLVIDSSDDMDEADKEERYEIPANNPSLIKRESLNEGEVDETFEPRFISRRQPINMPCQNYKGFSEENVSNSAGEMKKAGSSNFRNKSVKDRPLLRGTSSEESDVYETSGSEDGDHNETVQKHPKNAFLLSSLATRVLRPRSRSRSFIPINSELVDGNSTKKSLGEREDTKGFSTEEEDESETDDNAELVGSQNMKEADVIRTPSTKDSLGEDYDNVGDLNDSDQSHQAKEIVDDDGDEMETDTNISQSEISTQERLVV